MREKRWAAAVRWERRGRKRWLTSGACPHALLLLQVGDGEATGMCMKACGVCKACGPADVECINSNRKRSGYLPLDKEEFDWLGVPWWLGAEPSPEL